MKGNQKQKDPLDAFKVFPTRLRSIMAEKRVSRQELASTLGISRQAVSNYADGSSTPSWEGIVTIARTLGVTSDFLLGLSDYRTVETQGITFSDVGLSEAVAKNLAEADVYYPGAIMGINLLLEQRDALEIFSSLERIASVSSDAVHQIESGDKNLNSVFFGPKYDKDAMQITLDIDSYLSFAITEVCNLFRHWSVIQTGADRPQELLNQAFQRGQQLIKEGAITTPPEEEDENGIDTKENN